MNRENPDNWVGLALKDIRNLLNLLANGQICQHYPIKFAGREFHKVKIYLSPAEFKFTYDPLDDMSTQLTISRALLRFLVEGVPIIQETMLLDAILNLIKHGRTTTIITEMHNAICELIDTINDFAQEDLRLEKEKHVRMERPDGSYELVEKPIEANQFKLEEFRKRVKNTLQDLNVHRFLADLDQIVRHTIKRMKETTETRLQLEASYKSSTAREKKKRKLEEKKAQKKKETKTKKIKKEK